MIKTIFTNIKNEHRYLEEWIEYHIRLGINRFILYEDYDSISHSDIINKYMNVVNIELYDYVLEKDSSEFKDVTCFKHILENYNDIDWLIKLDPDEYISLPENVTIDDILYNVDDDIEQIEFTWKLYNANSFIFEPFPDKYSLIDTYLTDIDISQLARYFNINISENDYNIGKSFIRYKTFISKYGINNINTLFPHLITNGTTINANIFGGYINHYITKSFEEFYNRLKDKGEYNKEYHRKLGDFFVLNPDLIEKIPEIESKFNVDVFSFETKLN